MGLSLYKIDEQYNKKLFNLDNKVLDVSAYKAKRPFIGILIEVNDIKYVAPLSSPKKKHLTMKNNIDFYKIDSGKLGVINFNNMIPVKDEYIIKINPSIMEVNDKEDIKYIKLLEKQLTWINKQSNVERIIKKAKKLRELYFQNRLPKTIYDRCVDFRLLEKNII